MSFIFLIPSFVDWSVFLRQCWYSLQFTIKDHQMLLVLCALCSVTQSCPTLYDPMDCSLPGSSVHGILQARILERVAMPSSRGSSQPQDRTQVSHIAGRFFNVWATREAHEKHVYVYIHTYMCMYAYIHTHTLNTSLLKLVKQTFTFSMLNQQHSETMKASY